MDPIEELLDLLVDGASWPPRRFARRIEHVRLMRALLETDREALKVIADWPADRNYKVDGLPSLIADAWADHLWGEDPDIRPADDADEEELTRILEGNGDLVGDLHHAERIVSGEGEAWGRIYRDDDVADVPLLEWHEADVVFPLYIGGRLMAAALLTELERTSPRSPVVWRHFEIHAEGVVEHVLFKGTRGRIGKTVPLTEHQETAPLASWLRIEDNERAVWTHGLPMLMFRITNGRKRVKRLGNIGVSDFYSILDDLLDLNEAKTIAGENVRLTAKRRVVVPEDAVNASSPELVDRGDGTFNVAPRHKFDAGEDVLTVPALDAELGRSAPSPFTVLEYSFDAEPLLAHKRDLVESAVTRAGLTPQAIGVVTGQGDGYAVSGTALRLRLIPQTRAGRGKARPWDDTLPVALSLLQQVDALPTDDGGFGRASDWTDPAGIPSVERANALPRDEVEEATVEATLVGAGVRSIRSSVEAQHPDWTDAQVDDEVQAIKDERPAAGSLLGGV